jgi:general stress protein YciG
MANKRCFASFDAETKRMWSSLGGQAISRDRKHMAEIGRKGGLMLSRDREHMRKIGRMSKKRRNENVAGT